MSLSYVDPWVGANSRGVAQRLELLNRRLPLYATHGRSEGSEHPGLSMHKVTGGIEWAAPLLRNCQGKAGVHWHKATCMAASGEAVTQVSACHIDTHVPMVLEPVEVHGCEVRPGNGSEGTHVPLRHLL